MVNHLNQKLMILINSAEENVNLYVDIVQYQEFESTFNLHSLKKEKALFMSNYFPNFFKILFKMIKAKQKIQANHFLS